MNRLLITGVIGALIIGSFSGAWAAATITGADIVDGTIQSIDIGDKQVGNVDLATDSVDGTKIKNLSIKTSDLGDGIVTSGKIKDGTIQRTDVASGVLPSGATTVMFGSCQILVNFDPQEAPQDGAYACGPSPPGTDSTWNVVATMVDAGSITMWITRAWIMDPDEGPGGLFFYYHVDYDFELQNRPVKVAYIIYK